MILFELVETEVAYTQDLRTLVFVYLPQLASLPGLTEATTNAIARNSAQLLELHEKFMEKMVLVLRDENLRSLEGPDISGKLERVARKLASLFVDQVRADRAIDETMN